MESGDIGSGGAADRGSVLTGQLSECDVTGIICRCSHYYTAPVHNNVRIDLFASYIMAMLNTIYDTPTCFPVDGGSTDYLALSYIQWI